MDLGTMIERNNLRTKNMIHFFNVNKALIQFIDCYWIIDSDQPIETFLPDGSINLIINLNNPVQIHNHTSIKSLTNSALIGPQQNILTLSSNEHCKLVGVKFKIGKFNHFFQFPAYDLVNVIHTFKTSYEKEVNNLREFLLVDQQLLAIKNYLDRFLIKRLDDNQNPEIIDLALKQLLANESNYLIKDLCTEIGISNKHLIKLFKDNIGLAPKSLSRILKFQKVIKKINNNPEIQWPELAYSCNYFDQAHLINEFKFFSGMTPTNYSRLVHSSKPKIAV